MAAKKKILKTEAETHGDMLEALQSVADEQNVPREAIVESIEGAVVSAYKRAYGGTGAVRVAADFATSEFRVFTQKRVVQTVENDNIEISWREARLEKPDVNLGDEIEKEVTPSGFGRIAAQTAKQVLMQRLREAVRFQVASEYADKSGKAFRGTVLRLERGDVIVQVGKAEAVMPRREQAPGEHYRFGETIYVYVLDVRTNFRGPQVRVSRTHPGLVQQLFEREVPEIAEDIVQLKAVAREAGQRTKIAVAANNPDVDPVGACVGPRGNRVAKVVAELGNEKVDIVRWNADPITYISNALSPAQILKVMLTDDKGKESDAEGTATVVVAEDQQSLAIGKQGQNVRLAAKLTHWRIDIRTEKQLAEEQAKKMFTVGGDAFAPNVVAETPDAHSELFALDGSEDGDSNEAKATESVSVPVEIPTPAKPIFAPLSSTAEDADEGETFDFEAALAAQVIVDKETTPDFDRTLDDNIPSRVELDNDAAAMGETETSAAGALSASENYDQATHDVLNGTMDNDSSMSAIETSDATVTGDSVNESVTSNATNNDAADGSNAS